MKGLKSIISVVIFVALFASCKRNPLKVDLSEIEKKVEIVHFDEALFNLEGKDTLNTWVELSNAYPDFFNLFTYRIIKIGGLNDEDFSEFMRLFVCDTMIQDVRLKAEAIFSDRKKLEKQLTKAFKYYAYHFPDKELPTVYTYVSGFNQSVVTAENIIGISLDKYLGRDCEYYPQLNTTPQYKIQNMHKDKILSDVAFAWGITEFEDPASTTNLLGNMVEKGKLMYLVDAMLPDMPDSLKIGYTTQQLEWCELNEPQMWTYLIEHEMLYSTKRMDIVRYINDAPSTSGFPLDSPGRAGVWIGWQIVRKYMKDYPEITLPQLMANKNYQQILNYSGYNPE
jgi:gliding motility-associated lipoprotein GldB